MAMVTEATYEQRIVRKLREIAEGQERGKNAHWTFSMLKHVSYNLANDFDAADLTETYDALVRACEKLVVSHWRLTDYPDGDPMRESDATLALKLALAMRQIALGIEVGSSLGGRDDGSNLASHVIETGPLPGAYTGPEDDEPETLPAGE